MKAGEVEIIVIGDMTDGPILTVRVVTPLGTLALMGEIDIREKSIVVQGLHIGGDPAAQWGWSKLRALARLILEKLDVDEICIHGALRTTGANPGRRPSVVRIARSPRPASGEESEHA